MISKFLGKLIYPESIKRFASILFIIPIIVGIIFGIILGNNAGNGGIIILIPLFLVIGFIVGIILAFSWYVLGQILEYLSHLPKIQDDVQSLNNKIS